jgi:two-component system LytT family sensor kinase
MESSQHNFKNRQLILFLTQKKYRIFRHAIFLTTFLVLLYQGSFLSEYSDQDKLPVLFIIYIFLILMFYANMYILVPKFLMKGQYLLYLLLLFVLDTLGLFLISLTLNTYTSELSILPKSVQWSDHFHGVFLSILLISTSTTLKLFQRWTIDVERIAELKQLSLNQELNALKNQINPHFLFNMLNNVKSLTRKDPMMAGTVILKLSDFLRHQIYGKNDENVLLSGEMEFLSNFLNLEKIRRDHFQINIDMDTELNQIEIDNLRIPANLFTTFVENAVKHSIDPYENSSFIALHFIIGSRQLTFICRNSRAAHIVSRNKDSSGLGLANIQRRLDLLYQNRYSLNISQSEHEFCINLNIPL